MILGGVDSVLTPAKEGTAPSNVNCLEMVLHHHQKRSGMITVSSYIEYFRKKIIGLFMCIVGHSQQQR